MGKIACTRAISPKTEVIVLMIQPTFLQPN